ncbi:Putative short-chain dehydrogenase/reductase SDR, NAD(P)-binding domain superfamily [Colletotrichum destructivum]|uniref:Short-chain dehydrogenase/reductase 3 n=1 Tax=Colletotrichum destructivum TaxID=34406 RepID=A0AAX4HZ35_9PEZI|nr:Putative short-chain dehydrogenase/reductase SDR, NAD(P)-binding domain superfamily [Colletotrichum destructivum]
MSSPPSMLSRSVSGRHEELFRALRSFQALEVLARRGWPRFILSVLLGMAAIRRASSLLSLAALNNFTRDKYDWRRELVVVTGGSGGLGDGLVRKLAKNCVKVVSLDIVPPKDPLPSNAYFYKTDITSSTSVKEAADQIRQDHGEPTVLVNNAAVMPIASILDETEEQIRRVFDVNIVASFLLIKEFIPSMIRNNHGHVVNIASMASFVTGANNVDYACSKAGTLALHEGLTQELRHRYKAPKVRTSIVHPTYIRTALIEKVHAAGPFKSELLEPEPVVDAIFKQIMSGRSGHVYLPEKQRRIVGARGWPFWAQEALRNTQKDVLLH